MKHIDALELRLSNERSRLANAKTAQERELRAVWVRQCEKEIANEYAFLGKLEPIDIDISDDELFAELSQE